ncbi:MAG: hypothetical protein Q9212_004671 [Teloschistes hypoglaucus]
MADPLTAKISICPSFDQGLFYCCDNGRAPSVCCNNVTELLRGQAPFSSITAGPETQTMGTTLSLGAPYSKASATLTYVSKSAKPSSQPSMLAPNSTIVPIQNASSANATSQTDHHSRLAAGLGGGLGGLAGLSIIGIGLLWLWQRKKDQKGEKEELQELPPNRDHIHQPNSMLFPAELSHEDSKASISPFELDSQPIVEKPAGPYETPSNEGLLARKPTIPQKSEKRRSPLLQQANTPQQDEMLVNPLSNESSDGEAASKRALGNSRPDSIDSPSGPWHDRY